MIVTMDDLDDRAEARAERRSRRAQDWYMAQSPASGTWWRRWPEGDVDEDGDDVERVHGTPYVRPPERPRRRRPSMA